MTAVDSSIRTTETACSTCGAVECRTLYVGREHEYDNTTTAEFPMVVCTGCGLVRLNPRPDVTELDRIYPPEYYAYHLVAEGHDGSAPSLGQRLKTFMYQRRLEALLRRLGKPGAIRLLDIGCADGRLLDWYKGSRQGGRLETYGIEMSAEAAEAARRRGHQVVTGRFELDTELPTGHFDLILASHVIEHVADPVAFARRAAELLAPGGLFVVATPNVDSSDVRAFKEHWGGNHFPRHWTLYDDRSMEVLAAHVGLRQERVEYQVNPVFWVWSFHSWLRGRFGRRRWVDALFPPVRIFQPGLWNFALLAVFTSVDVALRLVTGKTASMSCELRKPRHG
jgi:SAM-dependent methyltransferase